MAVTIWKGTTDDFQTAGNWSTAAVPVDGDEVIFDGRVTQDVAQGMLDSESGLGTKGDYDLLHVKPTFTGDIGTATEPLCCHCRKVIFEGSGTMHLLCGEADQSTDATIDLVIMNSASGTLYLYSNCNDGANVCTFTNVHAIRGTLNIDYYSVDGEDNCGCYVANLYVSPLKNRSGNVTVTIDKDCYDVKTPAAGNIYMQTGTLTTDSQVGIFEVKGGTVNYGTDGAAETDMNITTLRQWGGTFNWYPDDSGDDAYIENVWLFGGSLLASATTNDDRAKVLGNGAGKDIHIFEGATLNIANNKGNITIKAGSQLWNLGGSVIVDRGAQIAISYDQP